MTFVSGLVSGIGERVWFLECDKCGKREGPFKDRPIQQKTAKDRGWYYSLTWPARDLCVDCKQQEQQDLGETP